MECPECGYFMTAFETGCPRCARLGESVARKRCPDCGEAARPWVRACKGCGHNWNPEPGEAGGAAEVEAVSAPVAPPALVMDPVIGAIRAPAPRPSILPLGLLGCPVCGHEDTQKVSAVYQGGSWTEQSSGSVGGVGMVWDGPAFVAVGETWQETHGHSRLAAALAPPPRPCGPPGGLRMLIGGLIVAVLGAVFGAVSLPFCLILIGIPFLLMGGITAIVGVFVAGRGLWAVCQGMKADAQVPRWGLVMDVWVRLFYCRRCDSVFDPATGRSAPSSNAQALLL